MATDPRDAAIQAAVDAAELRLQLTALQERLAAAEQVCVLTGWIGIGNQTDPLHRAITQAWLDWSHLPTVGQPDPQSPEWQSRIQDLANRRTATRTITMARIRHERDEASDGP